MLRNLINFKRLWMEVAFNMFKFLCSLANGPEFGANSAKTMRIDVFITACVSSELYVEGHRRILV